MSPPTTDGPAVVTGGAGAIGSVLVRALLDRGLDVRVIDNFSSGRKELLPKSAGRGKFSLTTADLREPERYQEQFRGAQAVWHLAANPDIRLGVADPSVDLEHGTMTSFRVLEAARRFDVPRVFFSSSSVIYGYAKVYPTPEDYGPLQPESLYGAAKLAGEGLFSAYAHCYGITSYIYRFANIIGPGMSHGVLIDFFEKLRKDPARLEVLGDGRQAKSYLRTEDCVEGMIVGGERSSAPVNIFNLGTEDRITVREIAEKVITAHGGRARIEYTGGERGWTGDVPQQLLAIDRIKALGWRPTTNSAGAVDRTIQELVGARKVPG
jgi:UDP-glucose 4-epimerase